MEIASATKTVSQRILEVIREILRQDEKSTIVLGDDFINEMMKTEHKSNLILDDISGNG